MFTGAILALTSLTAFALTSGQGNAAPEAYRYPGAAVGWLVMSNEPSFMGDIAVVREESIPSECARVPFGTVRSVANATSGGRISEIQFFSDAHCGDLVARLVSGSTTDPTVRLDFPTSASYRGVAVAG